MEPFMITVGVVACACVVLCLSLEVATQYFRAWRGNKSASLALDEPLTAIVNEAHSTSPYSEIQHRAVNIADRFLELWRTSEEEFPARHAIASAHNVAHAAQRGTASAAGLAAALDAIDVDPEELTRQSAMWSLSRLKQAELEHTLPPAARPAPR